jgi:hypothetical protein
MYKNFIFSLLFLLCSNLATSYAISSQENKGELKKPELQQALGKGHYCADLCKKVDGCKEAYDMCEYHCGLDLSCLPQCSFAFRNCILDDLKKTCP